MISPNPAVGDIKLTFNNPVGSGAVLNIYDVAGKFMTSFSLKNTSGTSTNINVSSFSNGVYWIELQDNGLKQTQKLVIGR